MALWGESFKPFIVCKRKRKTKRKTLYSEQANTKLSAWAVTSLYFFLVEPRGGTCTRRRRGEVARDVLWAIFELRMVDACKKSIILS